LLQITSSKKGLINVHLSSSFNYIPIKVNMMPNKSNETCSVHGGKRSGCGRKPGVKTHPIRLPAWLLKQLSEQGDPRQLIIDACLAIHPSICNQGSHIND
jgi:hypothetical protein